MGNTKSETSAASPLQKIVKVLCWIPIIGWWAEGYHVYSWGDYLCDPKNNMRWYGSALLPTISFLGFFMWIVI